MHQLLYLIARNFWLSFGLAAEKRNERDSKQPWSPVTGDNQEVFSEAWFENTLCSETPVQWEYWLGSPMLFFYHFC